MKYNFIYLFIIFFLIIGQSNAISIDITGSIEDYSTDYSETVSINLNCSEKISISTPQNAYNIKINNISTKNISFMISSCNFTNTLNYNLNSFEKINNNYRLERKFNDFNSSINYTYSIILPLEFELNSNKSIPRNYSIIYNSNQKKLKFNSNDIFVLYFTKIKSKENISITHLLYEITESSVIIISIISMMIGSLITYILLNHIFKKKTILEVPAYVLSKDEKKIIEIVSSNQGINQKQVAIKLDFSKSRVSAIVSDLENKQIIKREKFGRSFKLSIDKIIVEK